MKKLEIVIRSLVDFLSKNNIFVDVYLCRSGKGSWRSGLSSLEMVGGLLGRDMQNKDHRVGHDETYFNI